MLEFLFLDLDDTILDFHKAEYIAIGKTLDSFGLTPTDEVRARYSVINKAHWERLERKELTREEVLVGRFATLFAEYNIQADAVQCARRYEDFLSIGHYFLPMAEETLAVLSQKYRLFLASNGTAKVQAGRLQSANISLYFEKIFVSQEIGANKPSIEYFSRCFATIPDFDPKKAMMVGDSLTSDILGGKNAGITTCWVNPIHKNAPAGIVPDYEIEYFHQLPALLETL
jgi:2-haloacid dehalogenase